MRNLRLPEGINSVTVDEQSYVADKHGTLRDLEDHTAREIMAHDPRIAEFTPGGIDDPAGMPGANDKRVRFLARVGSMDRTELFAAGRALRVSMPANKPTDQLREIVLTHAAGANEDDLPIVVGGLGLDDGAKSILAADVEAQPNKGNDSLGTAGQHLSGGAGGATFSQTALTPAPQPGSLPPPPGAGMVLPTGTQQPPLNQLQTETGKPAHDDRLAPYPISVPPIDPLTGKPFAAGDPRIPETARPALRVAPGEVAPGVPDHAAIDAHEHRAAAVIEDAAFNLSHAAGVTDSFLDRDKTMDKSAPAAKT